MSELKVLCHTPTPGKKPTRIDRWKYEAVRTAILEVVPGSGEGLAFRDLPAAVAQSLSATDLARLGSVAWYTTSVKLDMEVKGELQRKKVARRQLLIKVI